MNIYLIHLILQHLGFHIWEDFYCSFSNFWGSFLFISVSLANNDLGKGWNKFRPWAEADIHRYSEIFCKIYKKTSAIKSILFKKRLHSWRFHLNLAKYFTSAFYRRHLIGQHFFQIQQHATEKKWYCSVFIVLLLTLNRYSKIKFNTVPVNSTSVYRHHIIKKSLEHF